MLIKNSTFKYKDLMFMGIKKIYYIYKIKNIRSNNFYIGQTGNVINRIKQHAFDARMKKNNMLGDPRYWVITILDVVKYKTSIEAIDKTKVLKKETFYIVRESKTKKCINRSVSLRDRLIKKYDEMYEKRLLLNLRDNYRASS